MKFPASPWDLITSTDKAGLTRFDARKTFETGSFISSTAAFGYLTGAGQLTEWFFLIYMGTWTAARYLRDREQRLAQAAKA